MYIYKTYAICSIFGFFRIFLQKILVLKVEPAIISTFQFSSLLSPFISLGNEIIGILETP